MQGHVRVSAEIGQRDRGFSFPGWFSLSSPGPGIEITKNRSEENAPLAFSVDCCTAVPIVCRCLSDYLWGERVHWTVRPLDHPVLEHASGQGEGKWWLYARAGLFVCLERETSGWFWRWLGAILNVVWRIQAQPK